MLSCYATFRALPSPSPVSFSLPPPRFDLLCFVQISPTPCSEHTTASGIAITVPLLMSVSYRTTSHYSSDVYYIMTRKNMLPQTKPGTRARRRIVAPAAKRTQVRLTVDSKFTKSHFNQLFAVLKIRNKNALAEHIIMNFKTKSSQAQVLAFYNGPWLNIPFQSIDTSFVFPLTYEIADELERIGGEILGGVNKSKTFRVMVAYFAAVHKLKVPVQSTFA